MAELFLARADGIEGFSKLVALKRILPHRAANQRFVRMFLAEARLVARLAHQNIAQVYDIGQYEGEYFFTMEYVHGLDLNRILHAAPNHRLQLENTLHVAIGLCAGLHHAHEACDENGRSLDIVHRDVSPSNVLVSYQGAVKLVDFGVAKAASIVSETQEGVVKGKYGYMSPEQCLGESLTRQSDVFNVGILLWEMTVGRRLYKINGDLVTLQRIAYADAPPPSRYIRNYPPALERIVMRALSRDLAKRHQTTEQLQLELEAFALDHRLPVSPVSMGLEMRQLFRDRIDAWQAAQQAGRSLADHLAEISSDVDVDLDDRDSSSDQISDVLEGLEATPDLPHVTQGERPSAKPPNTATTAVVTAPDPTRRPAAPTPVTVSPTPAGLQVTLQTAPARRRSRAPLYVGAVAVLAAGGFAAAMLLPLEHSAPAETSQPAAVTMTATPSVDAVVTPVDPTPKPRAAVTADEPAETEPEPTVDAAEPDVEAPTDASQKPARRRPVSVKKRPVDDKPKVDPPRPVEGRDALPDLVRPDPAKLAAAKPEPAKPEPAKPEPAKPEPTKPEPAKPVAPDGPKPGTIDPAGVRAVAAAHLGDIQVCVSRARIENRDLAGRVVIRIDVSPAGAVTRTTIVSSTGSTPVLESCIAKTVAGWTFPAPAGGVRGAFTYPFSF